MSMFPGITSEMAKHFSIILIKIDDVVPNLLSNPAFVSNLFIENYVTNPNSPIPLRCDYSKWNADWESFRSSFVTESKIK
ncbi:hypothetical protein RCL1_007842 [Eukaryota sp. TZLM3-RCL]